MINPILNIDSYKASHYLQYPPNTEYISSYIESRGGKFSEGLFFGLQYFIKKYLTTPITQADIHEAAEIIEAHGLPFNQSGWEYILKKHQGYLPIKIQSIAEGSIIPAHNVLCQVINTDPKCFWLPSYIETALLRAIWYPTTVATLSWHCKKTITYYLEQTSDTIDSIAFKLHDFGARGASSYESAGIGGLAHLVNFSGTDTLSSLVFAKNYYQENIAGYSIPAAEHSTITTWGIENESEAYQNMIKQFSGKDKLVAIVSDSYNLWKAIDEIWGKSLKESVVQNGGTIIIRPDSGDPVLTSIETIEKLMDHFGYSVNSKGFKVLPDYIRVIQGDGINLESIENILKTLKHHKISADNITFGMGGALLQKLNRDTMRFAMKTSYACIDNQWRNVYKDPVTDSQKRSKKGRLALIKSAEGYQTIREENLKPNQTNELMTVFENGQLKVDHSLSEIRKRAAAR